MGGPRVSELGDGRLMLDLNFRGKEGLIASYLVPAPSGWTLIESGPASVHESLVEGLREAGITPSEVTRVFVTHIHLDHAGGVGNLAIALPKAQFFVHALGLPHLVDPTRLRASAERAWGAGSDQLWGPILPTPGARLVPLSGGERFPVVGGDLRVIPTPGHASHHLAFFDRGASSLFVGDAAGVLIAAARSARPSLPPPDLDLEKLFSSLDALVQLDPRSVMYTHFGRGPRGVVELREHRHAVERWRDVALRAARESPDVAHVAAALRTTDEGASGGAAESSGEDDRVAMISGYEMTARGLLRYFTKKGFIEGASG